MLLCLPRLPTRTAVSSCFTDAGGPQPSCDLGVSFGAPIWITSRLCSPLHPCGQSGQGTLQLDQNFASCLGFSGGNHTRRYISLCGHLVKITKSSPLHLPLKEQHHVEGCLSGKVVESELLEISRKRLDKCQGKQCSITDSADIDEVGSQSTLFLRRNSSL